MGADNSKVQVHYENLVEAVLQIPPGHYLHPNEREGIYEKFNIVIVGLPHGGKSSLLNTILRVLNKEWDEKLTRHANTGPGGIGEQLTKMLSKYTPPRSSYVQLFDCFAATKFDDREKLFFKKVVTEGVRLGSTVSNVQPDPNNVMRVSILVVNLDQLNNNLERARITQLADILAECGKPLNGNISYFLLLTNKSK